MLGRAIPNQSEQLTAKLLVDRYLDHEHLLLTPCRLGNLRIRTEALWRDAEDQAHVPGVSTHGAH